MVSSVFLLSVFTPKYHCWKDSCLH